MGSVAGLHLATALAAYASIFPPEAPKPKLGDMEGRWRAILGEGIGWLAKVGTEPVGVAGLRPEGTGARLEALYVMPEFWGRGVGSLLADQAESEAVRRGWLPLRLWVLEQNTRSRDWYERRGWKRMQDARRTVWKSINDIGYVLGETKIAKWREPI